MNATIAFITIGLITISSGFDSFASGRMGELVFSFDEPKTFTYSEDPAEHSLVLNFTDVNPSDLGVLDRYDESVIKRVIIREVEQSGTQVTLSLRDPNLLATIDEFEEPYRIVVSIFDKDFKYEQDPQTGLPIVSPKRNPPKSIKSGPNDSLNLTNRLPLVQGDSFTTLAAGEQTSQAEGLNNVGGNLKLNKKHKLLKPQIQALESSEPLAISIEQESPGRGPGWSSYPVFAYPTQLAALGETELNASSDGMTGEQALADFSFKQFSFGHEKRALVGYQKVLHQDPRIFRRYPHHLWALAEAQFGQRNLALANGYFEMLMEQFPDAPHAQHAYLRKLDIQAIKMLGQQEGSKLQSLLIPLKKLTSRNNAEIETQKAIRKCYWTTPLVANFNSDLSLCDEETLNDLLRNERQVESRKTKFLAENLLLFNALAPGKGWTKELEERGASYFKAYDRQSGAPFYEKLKDLYIKKAVATIINASKRGDDALAVSIDQNLAREFDAVRKNAPTANSLAKSNRRLGQEVQALNYYEISEKLNNELLEKFEASFWIAVISTRLATLGSAIARGNRPASIYRQKARKADRRLQQIWNDMNKPSQNAVHKLFHREMRETLKDPALLKTPAKILLSSWKGLLESTEVGQDPTESNKEWTNNFSSAPVQVRLLRNLIDRFKKLGMNDERKQATQLLKLIKPKDMADDRGAQDLWTKKLSSLADEYRNDQEYLKAGRLYSFMANEALDWEDRAESLYKGGLLLYRAGKREEAIKSLTQASQDGNNLFYANLAKERLTQLSP